MIITRIKLDPFGGKTKTELNFLPGLNVISGPNEAGKSTVFAAISAALFDRTKLGKREFENRIRRFLPRGGGDTIRVELDFSSGGEDYRLKKSWGGTATAELTLPDRTTITDEETLENRLRPLLKATEGTYRALLLTPQSGLGRTLPDLQKNYPETLRELDDLLRSVLRETDGVSPDRFRAKVEKEYTHYFLHWDRVEDYPEKGRGINHPWVREVGEILRLFYEKEELKKTLAETRLQEEKLERINQGIEEKNRVRKVAEAYLKTHRKAMEDARERKSLSAGISEIRLRLQILEKDNSEWPVLESRQAELEKNLVGLAGKAEGIFRERSAAQANDDNRVLRERFSRAREKKKLLDAARKSLAELPEISREDLTKLRRAESEISRLRTGLAAGQISLRLTTKSPARITVRRDLAGPEERELAAGEAIEIQAGGRIGLDHPELAVEATSGERPFAEIAREFEEAKEIFSQTLQDLGRSGVEEAEAALRVREEAAGALRRAEEDLGAELGGLSYRELEEKAAALGPAEKTRPLPELIAEDEKLKGDIRLGRGESGRLKKQISAYVAQYSDRRSLLLATAEAAREEKELEETIARLAPLPEGVDDAGAFLNRYQNVEEESKILQREIHQLELERADIAAHLPEETEETLSGRLAEAEERFAAAGRAGEAIARIRDLAGALIKESDNDTFQDLKKDVEGMIGRLTGSRYRAVAMAGSLPQGLVRSDGQVLPPDLLSVGTRDGLALVVRLAMARRFLQKSSGFLLLDDPLVELDPERRQAAAELLRDFSADIQLLIFTCHPSHADLLPGRRIGLA